jgi:hypothetical protein
LQYLVHWEGYPQEEDIRELVKHLKHAQELITQFHAYNPRHPGPTKNIRAFYKEDELEELAKHLRLYNYIHGTTLAKDFKNLET